jgi:hypothetical protein
MEKKNTCKQYYDEIVKCFPSSPLQNKSLPVYTCALFLDRNVSGDTQNASSSRSPLRGWSEDTDVDVLAERDFCCSRVR